jgi:hypothetical protein
MNGPLEASSTDEKSRKTSLSPEQMDAIREFDTSPIAKAIEPFAIRNASSQFMDSRPAASSNRGFSTDKLLEAIRDRQ